MLVARNGLPGHSVYNAVRNCTELLEYAGVGTVDGRSRRIGKLAAGRSAEGLGKLAGTGMQTLPIGIPISQIRLQYPHGLAASLLLPESAEVSRCRRVQRYPHHLVLRAPACCTRLTTWLLQRGLSTAGSRSMCL
jgi:hypothetical protein